MQRIIDLLVEIISLGITEDCDDDGRLTRRVFTGASFFVGVVAPLWGAVYIAFGELYPGLIPSLYSVVTLVSFLALWRYGGWQWFRMSQLVLIFILPIGLMLSLGGFIPGSGVMIWAVLAPIGALWGGRSRESVAWVSAFLIAAIVSGFADPYLRETNNLPDTLITVLFVMNVTFVTGVIFLLLDFFVRQKDSLIDVLRRNRELEAAYLAQEITLRQSEKLATLGKLSAGMAHELNNPAAAVQQATHQLGALLLGDYQTEVELAGLNLAEADKETLNRYVAQIKPQAIKPVFLEPLDRSDRELALQEQLEGAGVEQAWDIAPDLVNLGLDSTDLSALAESLPADRFGEAVSVLARRYRRESLLGSLSESTERIIELVGALKSYTYLDAGPRQVIDLHVGLDSTLVMLQNRLKAGIEVQRSYADELPQIEAFGSELNQAWTNILDNAIDAMDGRGVIEIATRRDGESAVVEITDNGPGISRDVIDEVFDPFVTTKGPGEGTGLGLNITHSIVTKKHGGVISVSSRPGRTTFTVKLPVHAVADDGEPEADDPRPGTARSDPWQSQ